MRNKKRKTRPQNNILGQKKDSFTLEKNSPFWTACIVTITAALLWTGLSFVGYRAAENQYIDSPSLISFQHTSILTMEFSLMGWVYQWDFNQINQLAGWSQDYFTLIPAPVRLTKQLYSLGTKGVEHLQEIQRQQEFTNNV